MSFYKVLADPTESDQSRLKNTADPTIHTAYIYYYIKHVDIDPIRFSHKVPAPSGATPE